MQQLTKAQAKTFSKNKSWEPLTLRQRAEFQFNQEFLCMPFDVLHEAVEKTLGRPVYTHEFAYNRDQLRQELFEGKEPPTFEEILGMLPADKTILLVKE